MAGRDIVLLKGPLPSRCVAAIRWSTWSTTVFGLIRPGSKVSKLNIALQQDVVHYTSAFNVAADWCE